MADSHETKDEEGTGLPRGVIPSLPTPFKDDGALDLDGLGALVEHQVKAGVHALAVLGAMGEVAYLLSEEHAPVIRTTVDRAAGRVPVIVGISTSSTRQAVAEGQEAREAGASGLLVALPSAHRLPLPSVLAHFRTLAVEAGLPLILDRSLALTRWTASDAEIGRLLDTAGFKGLREARARPLHDLKLHSARAEKTALYVGNYSLLPEALDYGAAGTICSVVSLFPEEAVTLFEAYEDGDLVVSRQLTGQLAPIVPALFGARFSRTLSRGLLRVARAGMPVPRVNEPVMSAIKYGLGIQGLPISPRVRKPLPEVNARQRAQIRAELIRLGLIGGSDVRTVS